MNEANKAPTFSAEVLDQAFFGMPLPWSASSGAWILSLHIGPAIDADGNPINRLVYSGYQSKRLPRDRATWRRDGSQVHNLIDIRFPLCQTGAQVIASHWAMTPEGESKPRYIGLLATPLTIGPGVRPVVDAGDIRIEEI